MKYRERGVCGVIRRKGEQARHASSSPRCLMPDANSSNVTDLVGIIRQVINERATLRRQRGRTGLEKSTSGYQRHEEEEKEASQEDPNHTHNKRGRCGRGGCRRRRKSQTRIYPAVLIHHYDVTISPGGLYYSTL